MEGFAVSRHALSWMLPAARWSEGCYMARNHTPEGEAYGDFAELKRTVAFVKATGVTV